jgi:hypothetical protein
MLLAGVGGLGVGLMPLLDAGRPPDPLGAVLAHEVDRLLPAVMKHH